ncbi:aspartate/glutamate racemase family protein [Alphaproteobacteria bacterium]|nr:aspartate/glutamate racemase family protein [Alphaproteobacteria bacterium]
MSIEICIINPYATDKSNAKLKQCVSEVIDKNSTVYLNQNSIFEDYYSYYLETANVSKIVKEIESNNSSDAFIIACYEDTGIDVIRKMTSRPVIGIGEAAFYTANIIANKFSIITNLSASHEALKNNLIKYDLDNKCVSLKSIEVPILDMETMSKLNIKKLEGEINRTIVEDNPEAIIITSPGILNLTKIFSDRFNIPIVEGVTAAATLLETLLKQNLKIKRFTNPPNKNYGIPI